VEWERFLEWVRGGPWSATFQRNHVDAAIPQSAADIFADDDAISLLTIDLGGILVNCHFFSPEEIACDVDPREIDSEARFGALLAFVARLGGLLAREVILTPENGPHFVILRYVPDRDEVVFEPAA
jgi:hypothetical protein